MPFRTKSEKAAFLGLMTALALILGYVESRIPFYPGIPGIRLGLANIVGCFVLYAAGFLPALLVSLVRVILISVLFGTPVSMLYGLSGMILSLSLMALLKRCGRFSLIAVSAAGGAMHNLGQILMAVLLLGSSAVFYYLPVLLLFGELAGALTGLICHLLLNTLRKMQKGKLK